MTRLLFFSTSNYKRLKLKYYIIKNKRNHFRAVRRGVWSEFGIKKWNDLLFCAIKKVNVVSHKYIGRKGVEIPVMTRSIKFLEELKEQEYP